MNFTVIQNHNDLYSHNAIIRARVGGNEKIKGPVKEF